MPTAESGEEDDGCKLCRLPQALGRTAGTRLGRDLPGPLSGFARLHRKAIEDGALSGKVKELMALAVSIAVHCEACIAHHVHDALAVGATRQELLETIGVAVMMGGGPALMYAAHAQDAIDQFQAQPASSL